MKIYIRSAAAISPQETFGRKNFIVNPIYHPGNRLQAIEPEYAKIIDPKLLRRMSRIIKMGVATATECLLQAGETSPGGICMGTAYGCIQDTAIFLTQLIERNEDGPAPTAFIQSTHNVVGAQVALLLKCHSYNNTFVHGGHSFESALLDAMLLLKEGEATTVLAGSAEELTDTSYTLLQRFGVLKTSNLSTADLYKNNSKGTVTGEGAAFFLLSLEPGKQNHAELKGLHSFYKPKDDEAVHTQISSFLQSCGITTDDIDLVITGKNGDSKNDRIYDELKSRLFAKIATKEYKHLCGEYPTAVSFALWMAAQYIKNDFFVAQGNVENTKKVKTVLIYNHYQHTQHSLILVKTAE